MSDVQWRTDLCYDLKKMAETMLAVSARMRATGRVYEDAKCENHGAELMRASEMAEKWATEIKQEVRDEDV